MSPLDSARWWIERYQALPVPVPWMEKGPVLKGWNSLRLTIDSDLGQYFNGERQNIAILLGEPYHLTDVDLDAPEARWAWRHYAIPTGLKWGHRSNPSSHWLYRAETAPPTIKYVDPALEGDKACLMELRCLTKDGRVGLPVIVPPSQHPTDEPYEFTGSPGQPGLVDAPVLKRSCDRAAAAILLGRQLGRKACDGVRHQAFLAIAGALAFAKWPMAETECLVQAVYSVIWHEAADYRAADREVDSTYQHFDDGGSTTGLLQLESLIDAKVFQRVKELLDLEIQEAWRHQQPPPTKTVVLPALRAFHQLKEVKVMPTNTLINQFISTPGLTLMVGASKSGKTVLAMQMLMSAASNLDLFGNFSTHQANGLLIEWDDRRAIASLKEFQAKARASREHMPLHYSIFEEGRTDIEFCLSHPEFLPWLRKMIQETKARFVVLDSYTALRGFHSRAQDVVKLEATELTMLHSLAIECECAILLIHHISKTSAGQERHSRAAGSYAMQAASESQIIIERFSELPEADPARLVSVRGRHLAGTQIVVKFRAESLDFDLVLEGAPAEYYPDLVRLWAAFPRTAFDAADVQRELGWTRPTAYRVLSRLTGTGALTKDSKQWTWDRNFTAFDPAPSPNQTERTETDDD